MRILLFISIVFSTMTIHAQSGLIQVKMSQVPLSQVFKAIESQSNVRIYYRDEWTDSLNVSIDISNATIAETLDTLLAATDLFFYIQNQEVIITLGSPIIDKPAIGNSPLINELQVPKGLIFKQDYTQVENRTLSVVEIGSRKKSAGQKVATVAGYITDKGSGEPVEGALIYVMEPLTTATSDSSGFYSIELPKGKQTLLVQFLGMETREQSVVLFSNGRLDVKLEPDVISLSEVTISADRDANVQQVTMGVSKISVEQTKNVPVLLGERDILKIATTTAGVQSLGEGSSGFNVRGGKSDQNLILLDGATVYNSSHFFGFFSVFNSDAISDMNVFKSSIPSEYGGRLASVFDIHAKTEVTEKITGVGGISPITSKLTLQIPIVKEKASLTVGGRTTYSNWMLKAADNGRFSENKVSFQDLIVTYDHNINPKNNIGFSAYFSNDKFRLNSDSLFSFSDFSYKNNALSTFWDHQFSQKLTGQVMIAYSNYNYALEFDQSPPNAFVQNFSIDDLLISSKFNLYLGKHEMTYGASVRKYDVNPGTRLALGSESNIEEKTVEEDQGLETALYFSEDYKLNDKLRFSAGLRYTLFTSLGPKTDYSYLSGESKNASNRVDSTLYGAGEVEKMYHGLEPRISARYSFSKLTSVKFSYNRTRQYIHNLSNSASLSPTDIWVLSDSHIQPQIGDQLSIGVYQNLFRGKLELSLEGYYKWMQNLLDIKVGEDFLLNENIETVALQGPGKSYGVEFSVRKNGKLNGWINYTYARSFIKLDGNTLDETINRGEFYPTNYDKPHTLNLVTNYKVTRRLSLSYNFTYSTGRPTTFPVGVYNLKNEPVLHYSDRNKFRIPDYMRMDVGINLEEGHLLKKLTHSYWSFSIYNVLGRDNPFSVFFDIEDGQVRGNKVVVFGNPIPTLSFNFTF